MGDHMDMVIQLPMDTMERDLLMLNQRLMLSMVLMDMDMLLLMLMVTQLLMPMVPMEATWDKLMQHSLKKLKCKQSKSTINDAQFPKNKLNYCWCRKLS